MTVAAKSPVEQDVWEAHGPDEFGDFNISSKGEKLAKCVVVQNGFRTPEETASIATRLIKAVNSHDALVKALEAMCGYLLNAKIDLETGCTKATAIKTIEGGIKQAREALAIATPSRSGGDVMRSLLLQMAQELEFQLAQSSAR